MARKIHPHGSYLRYQQGCTCQPCKADNARYNRERRARQRTGSKPKSNNVVSLAATGTSTQSAPESSPASPGRIEAAIKAECEALPTSKDRPGTVQMALAMARILDDNECKSMWPTTSRQLETLLNSLRSTGNRKSKGRLAAVQAITTRREAESG